MGRRRNKVKRLGKGREYYDYIQSDSWKSVKLRYIESRYPKNCYFCDDAWNKSFHFHHRTYKRLGRELLSGIVPICRRCHEAVHEMNKKKLCSLWPKRNIVRRYIGLEEVKRNRRGVAIGAKIILDVPLCDLPKSLIEMKEKLGLPIAQHTVLWDKDSWDELEMK